MEAKQKKGPKKRMFDDFRRHKTYYFMAIPMVVFFLLFSYLPLPGLYYAFVDYDFMQGLKSPFCGFKNFEFLFSGGMDSIIWKLTRNTILYNLAFIIVGNIAQITVAVLLKEIHRKYFVKVSQTLMFMPYFVSMVTVGVVVYNIFNYKYGVANNLLTSLGLEKFDFYQTPEVWPFIIVAVQVWKGLGYGSVVYMAAILGIDESIYEAAYVDGATHFRTLYSVVLPLSKPILAVMVLFYAIAHWNSYFNAMIYLSDKERYPLQLVLRTILVQSQSSEEILADVQGTFNRMLMSETIKYALIIVASVPVLCLYPFLQKYFVQGVMIGSVKG